MKKVVMTGEFLTDINEWRKTLNSVGFEITKNLNFEVSYLVVGDACRSYWASSRTGVLIHEATRMELNGQNIEVINESELQDKLRNLNPLSSEL
jgi:hypothetical protein